MKVSLLLKWDPDSFGGVDEARCLGSLGWDHWRQRRSLGGGRLFPLLGSLQHLRLRQGDAGCLRSGWHSVFWGNQTASVRQSMIEEEGR